MSFSAFLLELDLESLDLFDLDEALEDELDRELDFDRCRDLDLELELLLLLFLTLDLDLIPPEHESKSM